MWMGWRNVEHGVENDVNGMEKVGHEERRTIYLAMERRKHNFFGGGQGYRQELVKFKIE